MIAVFLSSCGAKSNVNGEPPVLKRVEILLDFIDSENGKPLKDVIEGTQFRLVLELKNLTDAPLTLDFSSGKHYDFEVHDANKQLVWSWSHDKAFPQAFSALTLAPKEQIKFMTIWDQKDNAGSPVPAGVYRVTAMITNIGPESVSHLTKDLIIKQKLETQGSP